MSDPYFRIKAGISIVVTGVWTATFLVTLFNRDANATALVSVQAVMMLTAGALWADRLRRRNGDK